MYMDDVAKYYATLVKFVKEYSVTWMEKVFSR
jgi:hypothetical protein